MSKRDAFSVATGILLLLGAMIVLYVSSRFDSRAACERGKQNVASSIRVGQAVLDAFHETDAKIGNLTPRRLSAESRIEVAVADLKTRTGSRLSCGEKFPIVPYIAARRLR